MSSRPLHAAILLLAGLLVACSDAPSPVASSAEKPAVRDAAASPSAPAAKNGDSVADAAREIEWDTLIPDDYRPDQLMAEYQVDDLADDDPRARELMAKLRELWDQAPVREDLDGELVRLPGFTVPVEDDTDQSSGFLLVPYYGACVHVPPPPANQTVYVLTEANQGTRPGLFDVVWVTGTMSVKRIGNDVAEAGYTLYASDVAPYE